MWAGVGLEWGDIGSIRSRSAGQSPRLSSERGKRGEREGTIRTQNSYSPKACLEAYRVSSGSGGKNSQGKEAKYALLNCDDHQGILAKTGRDIADARPDITHQVCLRFLVSWFFGVAEGAGPAWAVGSWSCASGPMWSVSVSAPSGLDPSDIVHGPSDGSMAISDDLQAAMNRTQRPL